MDEKIKEMKAYALKYVKEWIADGGYGDCKGVEDATAKILKQVENIADTADFIIWMRESAYDQESAYSILFDEIKITKLTKLERNEFFSRGWDI